MISSKKELLKEQYLSNSFSGYSTTIPHWNLKLRFKADDAGVASIMVGHTAWNGLEMVANQYLLTDVLKNELGFQGFVVSDWFTNLFLKTCCMRFRMTIFIETNNMKKYFEHVSGREQIVEITNKKHLFRGGMGSIYLVETQQGTKKRNYILKEFGNSDAANSAIHNYQLLKNAGLKVFPTYRKEKDGKSILMTNAHTENSVCLSSNYDDDSTLEYFGEKPIETLANPERLFNQVFEQIDRANKNGIRLIKDTLVFFVPRKQKKAVEVEFLFGDTDLVSQHTKLTQIDLAENLFSARQALRTLLKNNVNHPEPYLESVDNMYRSYMNRDHIPYIHRMDLDS